MRFSIETSGVQKAKYPNGKKSNSNICSPLINPIA